MMKNEIQVENRRVARDGKISWKEWNELRILKKKKKKLNETQNLTKWQIVHHAIEKYNVKVIAGKWKRRVLLKIVKKK